MPPAPGELVAACRAGDVGAAEALLAAGAPPDAAAGGGETPLHAAVRGGAAAAAELLLRAGANPDVPDAHGNTAAELAVAAGDAVMTRHFAAAAAHSGGGSAQAGATDSAAEAKPQPGCCGRLRGYLPSKEQLAIITVSWSVAYFCVTTTVDTLRDLSWSLHDDE
eukprot:TRINITY_DN24730_c0_g1_i2.p1 TRINITY_DN24730_c0_g1~~TRINITY_DN24730_c0_g1_i2.p1  ORF type:complete len:165 (+),score=44.21 TRINITY_DN24730_c0_g1_i2:92-586(+)